jgi:hypothetical protein
MGEKVTSAADLLTRARGADAPPSWMRRSQSRLEQQADEVQNRILGVILNVEAALEMTDGPARARLQKALRAAWSASELVDALPLADRIGSSQLS